MLRIGEFSVLSQVPVKTLRYYDDIGLLPSASIDPQTGYRYYEAVQLTRLFRIRAFRELGFSLDEIALLLNPELAEAERSLIITHRREEQAKQVQREQQRLRRLQHLTIQTEAKPSNSMSASIFFKSLPALQVAAWRDQALCRTDVLLEQEITARFLALTAFLQMHRLHMVGDGILLWHDTEWQEERMDMEIAIPVEAEDADAMPPHDSIRLAELPPVPLAACITYQGSAQGGQAQAAYVALADSLQAQNFQLTGPRREVTLHFDLLTSDRKVEVQFPITLFPTS